MNKMFDARLKDFGTDETWEMYCDYCVSKGKEPNEDITIGSYIIGFLKVCSLIVFFLILSHICCPIFIYYMIKSFINLSLFRWIIVYNSIYFLIRTLRSLLNILI